MVTAAVGRGDSRPASMSIGAVLALLRPDFPDVSISKIRFLEDQGLVEPERTPSGYRKFRPRDVERLRYVLGVQRDHYLPLRVIRDHLAAVDRGLEPPVTRGGPSSPRLVGPSSREQSRPRDARDLSRRPGSEQRLSRAQLLAVTGAAEAVLADLESHGLITARPSGMYDADAVVVTRTAIELAVFGIEPRHLRAFRAAADREAGLIEQVVSPLRRHRGPEAAARAEEATRELSGLCLRLHATLVRAALERGGS